MTSLTTTGRTVPAGLVLTIAGDLDYETAGRLRARVAGLVLRPGQILVLDLSGLGFCDSSGIAAFVAARNHALDAGARLALAAVPAGTVRILGMLGLDQIFPMHADADAAVAAAQAAEDHDR